MSVWLCFTDRFLNCKKPPRCDGRLAVYFRPKAGGQVVSYSKRVSTSHSYFYKKYVYRENTRRKIPPKDIKITVLRIWWNKLPFSMVIMTFIIIIVELILYRYLIILISFSTYWRHCNCWLYRVYFNPHD